MIRVFYSIWLQTSEHTFLFLMWCHINEPMHKNGDEWCSRKTKQITHLSKCCYCTTLIKITENEQKTIKYMKKTNERWCERRSQIKIEKNNITKNNIHYTECLCQILKADWLECTVCNVCIECVQKNERFKVLIANRFSTSRVWKSIYFCNTLLFMLMFSMEKPAVRLHWQWSMMWEQKKAREEYVMKWKKTGALTHTHTHMDKWHFKTDS